MAYEAWLLPELERAAAASESLPLWMKPAMPLLDAAEDPVEPEPVDA